MREEKLEAPPLLQYAGRETFALHAGRPPVRYHWPLACPFRIYAEWQIFASAVYRSRLIPIRWRIFATYPSRKTSSQTLFSRVDAVTSTVIHDALNSSMDCDDDKVGTQLQGNNTVLLEIFLTSGTPSTSTATHLMKNLTVEFCLT